MTKEATMSFRVEEDLREAFHAAVAERERRPGAQVLREYMRDYVDGRVEPLISPTEQRRRKEAARQARATVELEGIKLSRGTIERFQRFETGEIDIEQMLAEAREEARGS